MRKIFKVLAVVLILSVGVGAYVGLASQKKSPKKGNQKERPVVVETISASVTPQRVLVEAMGTVTPKRRVAITPQVAGTVVYQNPQLIPGGHLKKGQVLIRIDPRDYELAVKQQQAAVSQAKLQLATERGAKAVAEKEWALIKDEVQPTQEGRKLALREVQLETAKVALESAQSGLQQAKLQLSRTVIRAPFDAVVVEKNVDQGQVVGQGQAIATLVASDAFWVQVTVPVSSLRWIALPSQEGQNGAPARITQKQESQIISQRFGRVVRLMSELESRSRMARVLVEIPQPMNTGQSPLPKEAETGPASAWVQDTGDGSGLDSSPGLGLPLLLGAYVQVEIQGPLVKNVYRLPRRALRDGSRLWVKTGSNTLAIRPVEVVWSHQDAVFVHAELGPQEQVILSRIGTPVEGMAVTGSEPVSRHQPGAKGASARIEGFSRRSQRRPARQERTL